MVNNHNCSFTLINLKLCQSVSVRVLNFLSTFTAIIYTKCFLFVECMQL